MGLALCRYFDPQFSIDKVVFLGSDFMNAVKAAAKGSWILFDEPNLGIGHRTFMNIVNRTVAGFVQASRFLGVNAIFALPSADLMDTAVVRVAHIRIRVTARGWGKVERIKHAEFEGGPRIRFKGMGTVKVGLPPRVFLDAYEDKRRAFHSEFFKSEGIAQIERGIIPEAKPDYLETIMNDPLSFMVPHRGDRSDMRLSTGKIAGILNLSESKASNLKSRAEYLLSKKQPLIQS